MEDLSILLENALLNYVRVAGIFFVAAIALFNFTNYGKIFSIVSLIVALLLLVAALGEYLFERHRISQQGIYPKTITDILAFIMFGIIFLIIWIIYQVWLTEPTSLSSLIKEVEDEIDIANTQLIMNIRELDEKIIATNRELLDVIKGEKSSGKIETSFSKPLISSADLVSQIKRHKDAIKSIGKKQENRVIFASLAAVS